MPVEDGQWFEEVDDDDLIAPAEQADLGAQSIGPEDVEMNSVLPDTEPLGATQTEASPAAETSDDVLPEFDAKYREDFEGLLYLGRLTDEFTWLGHRFVIRTLTTGNLIEIGLLHKDYSGSLADVKAYQALVVAASLVTVDGQSLPLPLSSDKTDTELINAFRQVLRWYPIAIDGVYERIMLLEARVNAVVEEMAKVQG